MWIGLIVPILQKMFGIIKHLPWINDIRLQNITIPVVFKTSSVVIFYYLSPISAAVFRDIDIALLFIYTADFPKTETTIVGNYADNITLLSSKDYVTASI